MGKYLKTDIMKKKLLLFVAIVVGVLVIGIIVKKNAEKKLDNFDQDKSVPATEAHVKKSQPSYWQAEGDKYGIVDLNQETIDYLNSKETLDFIYVFNNDNTGFVMSHDIKTKLFKFDYVLNGTILTINDGKHDYYFKKFNENTFICSNNFGFASVIKIRRIE